MNRNKFPFDIDGDIINGRVIGYRYDLESDTQVFTIWTQFGEIHVSDRDLSYGNLDAYFEDFLGVKDDARAMLFVSGSEMEYIDILHSLDNLSVFYDVVCRGVSYSEFRSCMTISFIISPKGDYAKFLEANK